MFSKEPTISINNSEGAILMQLIFQVFAGTSVLDEHFNEILGVVHQRMQTAPMQDYLKRHLLSVYLTALGYNSTKTLAFLESHGILSAFFE